MGTLTVRNLPEDVHRALKLRAARHGCSTEAEVRSILESAVKPKDRLRLGDALAAIGGKGGLSDVEVKTIERGSGRRPAEPMKFR